MRAFDQILRILMWLGIVAGLAYFATVFYDGAVKGNMKGRQDWLEVIVPFGLLCLPPLAGVWSWDGNRTGHQSKAFYVSAAVAIGLAVLIVVFFGAMLSMFD